MNQFLYAKNTYALSGIDVEKALSVLRTIPVSLPCWQGDDVTGFEIQPSTLSGGIQSTGNHPGKARNFTEWKSDFLKAVSHIPGMKRINLHAMYAITDSFVDRDALKPEHFMAWLDFARDHGLKIDFNPTFFSHPLVSNNMTLSSPEDSVRAFWIRHGIACRKIAAWIGQQQGSPCLNNLWIPDGMKDIPADRLGPRRRLKDSLDQIFAARYPREYLIDSVESKVFGIGLESYTVGSAEFYLNYAKERGICNLIDNGHYHPTENVADKISSLLLFSDHVALHLTRPVRWDSDHVVRLDDTTEEIAQAIIASGTPERFSIGLDYFDGSINRVAAWIIGARNLQKALLKALLIPWENFKNLQDRGDFTWLLALQEEVKSLPFSAIWAEYCAREHVGSDSGWIDDVMKYEQEVQLKR
jgi:L-rhamnose isomerase